MGEAAVTPHDPGTTRLEALMREILAGISKTQVLIEAGLAHPGWRDIGPELLLNAARLASVEATVLAESAARELLVTEAERPALAPLPARRTRRSAGALRLA